MLPIATVHQIKQLLDEGELSQRKIAKKLSVSRGVVADIANGRRGLHGRETSRTDEPEAGPPERCPTCGFLVFMPCVYCQAIAYQQRKSEAKPTLGVVHPDAANAHEAPPRPVRPHAA